MKVASGNHKREKAGGTAFATLNAWMGICYCTMPA
jgi:hypothetical protein